MTGTMAEIMDGLAELVPTNNAYAWPVESIAVPCFVVGYPTVAYDLTFMDGGDTLTFPVWQIVGKSGGKDARDALSDALSGVGSVKAALDGEHSFGDVRVTNAEVAEMTVAGVSYIGLAFQAEVI